MPSQTVKDINIAIFNLWKRLKATPRLLDHEQVYNDLTTVVSCAVFVTALVAGYEDDDSESGSGSDSSDTGEEERTLESVSASEATEADEPSLDDEIDHAPPERLRSVLKYVCEKNEFARQLTTHRLLAPAGNGESRKRRRFETCAKCGDEYDICSSVRTCSPRHSGALETDPGWREWGEEIYDHLQQQIDDPEYARFFQWSCCGKPKNDPGCRFSKHSSELTEPLKKKAKN